ncbi:MAG: hypothetical protein IKB02_05610 [Clostridia bacterium]|nr:hypothetical protein [Clostridia bacterium]
MNYRYRVKGVAEKAFILRGMHFRVGSEIDTDILETEMTFVKERCKLTDLVDRQIQTATSEPIPNNSVNKSKVTKNELSKSKSGANKGANKAKI